MGGRRGEEMPAQTCSRAAGQKKMSEIFTHWCSFQMRHLHVGGFYSVKLYSQLRSTRAYTQTPLLLPVGAASSRRVTLVSDEGNTVGSHNSHYFLHHSCSGAAGWKIDCQVGSSCSGGSSFPESTGEVKMFS